MASGSKTVNATFTPSGVVCDVIKFSWQENSQSVANNSTVVGWKLELISYKYGYIDSSATKKWSVTVNGQNYSGTNKVGIADYSSKVLASGTTTITHNSNGTKSFSYSFSQELKINFNTYVGTISGSGSGTLTTIARASQPSLITYPENTQDVGYFGDTISVHMNRASSSFTHKVRYAFGSLSGTCIDAETGKEATAVTTGFKWTIPKSLMNAIPNSQEGSGRVYVDTYNGTTLIGTKYSGFTAKVKTADVAPDLTMTLEDTTGIDSIYGDFVQGLSKIKVTAKATPKYGTSIVSSKISIDGKSYSSLNVTTDVLVNSGNSMPSVDVWDGRGMWQTFMTSMTVLPYARPSVTKLTVHRCDSDGTANDQGTHINAVFSAKVTSLNSKNTATYTLKYKKTSDTTWNTVTLSANTGKYTVTDYAYRFEADGSYSWDVSVTATDKHYSTTRSTSASTAFTLFNCHSSGTGWRFGGVAEEEYTVQNDLALKQVGNSYSFQPSAFDGKKGYTLLALITLNTLNVNAPIVFTINRRGALCPMQVYVRFASSSTTTDPELGSISYEGDNYGAFLVKETTSTWKLYVDNTTGWLNPCLQSWYTTDNQMSRISVEFPSELVEGTEPNVLGTYYRATPAKMQSILDFIYPVGSVYISYSHVSPETLFGGTWERIENAFLWATTSGGTIGQKGGESEHTLTLSEMPSHSHSFNANLKWDATDGNYANFRTASNNNNMGINSLNTVSAGGGKPHNNMPPYIQVSVWRRTA